MPPLISILTPTHNHGKFIEQCLNSVIAQSEVRWEQIVIDDASTDETERVIARVQDPRIRYIRQEHEGIDGLARTYNKALGLAQGSLVAILEGDDFWPRDKLERQITAFADKGVVLAWGQAGMTDESGTVRELIPRRSVVAKMRGRSGADAMRNLLEGNYIPACTVMCRRVSLEAIGGFWQPAGVPTTDYPTWLRMCRVGTLSPIDGLLGYWRRHSDQVSVKMDAAMGAIPALPWASMIASDMSPVERRTFGLSSRQTQRLDGWRRAQIEFSAGRMAWRQHRRAIAEAYFRSALRTGSATVRIKAIISLVCAALGVDPEILVGLRDTVRRKLRDRSAGKPW